MTKKPKRRLPYVGDDPVTGQAYLKTPTQIKPVEHACSVCGNPYAPFAIGFPENPQWFCRKHVIEGGHMPEVQNDIERAKLNEIRRRTVNGARLWLDLYVACAEGDAEGARQIWPRIRDMSVEVSDILKTLVKGG